MKQRNRMSLRQMSPRKRPPIVAYTGTSKNDSSRREPTCAVTFGMSIHTWVRYRERKNRVRYQCSKCQIVSEWDWLSIPDPEPERELPQRVPTPAPPGTEDWSEHIPEPEVLEQVVALLKAMPEDEEPDFASYLHTLKKDKLREVATERGVVWRAYHTRPALIEKIMATVNK